MENGTGIALSEFLHNRYPEVKIIIITAFQNFTYAQKALELGVFSYILKPINEEEVLEKVGAAIQAMEKEKEKSQLINTLTKAQITKNLQEFLDGSKIQLPILKQVLSSTDAKTWYAAISIKSKDRTHISSTSCLMAFSNYFENSYLIRLNGYLTTILILDRKELLNESVMEEIYHSIYRNSRICIGEIVSDLEELPYSLQTSYLAHNISFLYNTRGIVRYDEVKSLTLDTGDFGIHTYMEYSRLKDLIFKDRKEEYTDYIERIFSTYQKTNVDQKFIFSHCVEALKYLCNVVNEYLMYKSLIKIDYGKVFDFTDLSELKAWFLSQIVMLHHEINIKRHEKIRPIVKLVLEYSIKNIRDPSLNLKTIACHFKFSYAYLSKAFKEDFNKSYTEYMNLYRLEQAKKQLLNTDRKIYEICDQIGLEPKNFYYLFKKYEGITPKEFKSINHVNLENEGDKV